MTGVEKESDHSVRHHPVALNGKANDSTVQSLKPKAIKARTSPLRLKIDVGKAGSDWNWNEVANARSNTPKQASSKSAPIIPSRNPG